MAPAFVGVNGSPLMLPAMDSGRNSRATSRNRDRGGAAQLSQLGLRGAPLSLARLTSPGLVASFAPLFGGGVSNKGKCAVI
jgi:hypothetical protein